MGDSHRRLRLALDRVVVSMLRCLRRGYFRPEEALAINFEWVLLFNQRIYDGFGAGAVPFRITRKAGYFLA